MQGGSVLLLLTTTVQKAMVGQGDGLADFPE